MMTNKGEAKINISGHGTLIADVVAVGYRAHAQKVVNAAGAELADKGFAEVKTRLDALMAALNQHANELADPQPIFELAERVAAN